MSENSVKNELVTQHQGLAPVDVDSAVEFWKNYQELTTALLDSGDYQKIGSKSFKKKSAWRKYATAFNISDEIIKEDIRYDGDGRVVTATYHVKATASNGREGVGIGVCSIFDKSHEYDKLDKNNNISCKGPCNGRRHFDKPEHDIPSTAHTRAKNRAIADLIGAGEVTADEVSEKKSSTKPKTTKKKVVTKKEEKKAEEVQDAEFTKKTSKPMVTMDDKLDEKAIKSLSENKFISEAINTLQSGLKLVNKKNILKELADMLGEQRLTMEEKSKAQELLVSYGK